MGWRMLRRLEKRGRVGENYEKEVAEIYELDSSEDFDAFLVAFKRRGGLVIERRGALAFYFTVEGVEITRRPPTASGRLQVVATLTLSLLTQSEMGEALIRLGRTDEGFAKIDDAIAQLDKVRRFTEMDVCVRVMKSKIRSLDKQNRYEEIIPVAERIVEKMSDYGEHPADYDDGSERMPTEDHRPGNKTRTDPTARGEAQTGGENTRA